MSAKKVKSKIKSWFLTGVVLLFFGLTGLVLSYFLWNNIKTTVTVPCSLGQENQVKQAEVNFAAASSLVGEDSPPLAITLTHIFQFPFDYAVIVPPLSKVEAFEERLGYPWPCAKKWVRAVSHSEAYISVLAVAGQEVTAIRLKRTDYALAESFLSHLSPGTPLYLHRRENSRQIFIGLTK